MTLSVGNLFRFQNFSCSDIEQDTGQEVIVDEELTTPADFTIDSIPQTYDHLQLFMTVRSTHTSADFVVMSFNNDIVDANYHWELNGAQATVSIVDHGNNRYVCNGKLAFDGSIAGAWSRIEVFIPFYTNPTFFKYALVKYGTFFYTGSGTGLAVVHSGFMWKNTSPIEKINLEALNGSFETLSNLQAIVIKGI